MDEMTDGQNGQTSIIAGRFSTEKAAMSWKNYLHHLLMSAHEVTV